MVYAVWMLCSSISSSYSEMMVINNDFGDDMNNMYPIAGVLILQIMDAIQFRILAARPI